MNDRTDTPKRGKERQVSVIIAGLAWQESLLQAYRNYLLVTQSIFLAVNVGLLSAQISAESLFEKLTFGMPFTIIFFLGISTLSILNRATIERAKAVDWWQRRLLKVENDSANDQHFLSFRIAKEHEFQPPEVEAYQLDAPQIESLLRAERPKVRRVFDLFVPGFATIWCVLFLCAALNLWNDLSTFD